METPELRAQWTAVDNYFASHQIPKDAALQSALHESNEAGLPPQNVAPNQGKFLHLLARIHGAKNILEIGTLGAYSTIWFARALPEGSGKVVTLEVNEKCAAVARRNLERAGVQDRVEVILGKAEDSMARLVAENRHPFDLIFIDADKASNTTYLHWSMKLAKQVPILGSVAPLALSFPCTLVQFSCSLIRLRGLSSLQITVR